MGEAASGDFCCACFALALKGAKSNLETFTAPSFWKQFDSVFLLTNVYVDLEHFFLSFNFHFSHLIYCLKSVQKKISQARKLWILAKGIINHIGGSNAAVVLWLLNYLVSSYEMSEVAGVFFNPKLIFCRHSFHCLILLHHFPFHYQMVELGLKHKLPEDR